MRDSDLLRSLVILTIDFLIASGDLAASNEPSCFCNISISLSDKGPIPAEPLLLIAFSSLILSIANLDTMTSLASYQSLAAKLGKALNKEPNPVVV